jgi:dimethylamine corrinoid protein
MDADKTMNEIIEAIIGLDGDKIAALSLKAVADGINPLAVVNDALTAGLRKVGDLFADEEMFLPELVKAGNLVAAAMEKIKPHLAAGDSFGRKGLSLIATVEGDVHDIGKNLVVLLLSSSGYEVVDLGKSIPTRIIVEKVKQMKPDLLGLSALLSTTMPAQRKVIQALEEAGIRERLKIMVGGAPVTRSWAEKIGADGFAEDASSAVKEADRLMGVR